MRLTFMVIARVALLCVSALASVDTPSFNNKADTVIYDRGTVGYSGRILLQRLRGSLQNTTNVHLPETSSLADDDSTLPVWGVPLASKISGKTTSDEPALSLPRSLWGSGFDAKFSSVPEWAADQPYLVWSSAAEDIFARRWHELQFPAEGCIQRAHDIGYAEARIDMEWGVTSVLRDVQDQFLYGLFEGLFVVFSDSVDPSEKIQDAMKQYRDSCGEGAWIEQCYFENLTGCTQELLNGDLPASSVRLGRRTPSITSDAGWFLAKSQPIFEEMQRIGAVEWRYAAERRPDSHYAERVAANQSNAGNHSEVNALLDVGVEDEYGDASVQDQLEAAQRLAMFRALMLRTVFHPNSRLRTAIAAVKQRTRLPQLAEDGQLVVVHVRRTDKSMDFEGGKQSAGEKEAFANAYAKEGVRGTLSTISDILLPWLERGTAPIANLFVMSDDWHTFENHSLETLQRSLKNRSLKIAYDPESSRFVPQDMEHLTQGNEAWGHKAEIGLQILAESYAVGDSARYIVGCGSSGVTQLIAQLIGGRLRIEPNVVALWEDDALNVRAAGGTMTLLTMSVDEGPASDLGSTSMEEVSVADVDVATDHEGDVDNSSPSVPDVRSDAELTSVAMAALIVSCLLALVASS